MAITEKMNILLTEKQQRELAIEACALLRQIRDLGIEVNSRLQTIADSGSFNTIDTEIKQTLVAAWNALQQLNSSLADTAITDILTGFDSVVCKYCGGARAAAL